MLRNSTQRSKPLIVTLAETVNNRVTLAANPGVSTTHCAAYSTARRVAVQAAENLAIDHRTTFSALRAMAAQLGAGFSNLLSGFVSCRFNAFLPASAALKGQVQ